jgi:hypothetical protein
LIPRTTVVEAEEDARCFLNSDSLAASSAFKSKNEVALTPDAFDFFEVDMLVYVALCAAQRAWAVVAGGE